MRQKNSARLNFKIATSTANIKLDKISKVVSKAYKQRLQIAAVIADNGDNFLCQINYSSFFKKLVGIVPDIKRFIKHTRYLKERRVIKCTLIPKELDDALY